jgi:hypothetical protein
MITQPMIPCSLSQLIRVGAGLKPQGFGQPVKDGKTCAFGAAYDALGILDNPRRWRSIERLYPYVNDVVDGTSACRYLRSEPLRYIVTHLNDCHHWTREAIADWVEEYEESIGYVTVSEVPVVQPATVAAEVVGL